MVPASESSGEHENGRFWRVKISDKCVDSLEFEARINENVVFAHGFAGFGPIFKRASNSSTDGNDAMTRLLCLGDGVQSVIRNMKPFGMHMMFLNIVAADWQKSAETDV